jgi:hypothetical protein
MTPAQPLSVAVRLPAVRARAGDCLDALRAHGGIEIRRLEETGPAQPLDLILDLTSRPAEPSHLVWPRYGYWTFLYGERPERIAPGLPEILSGQRAAFVRLARLVPGGKAVILREGSVKTVLHSPARTRRRLLEAARRWPAEKLDQLARSGAAPEGAEIELPVRSRAARIGLLARLPAALARNAARKASQMLTREHWRIGVIEQPIGKVVEAFDPAAIQWLDLPFEGFLADPFGIAGPEGGLIILAEAFPWKERRGRIAAIERRRNGALALAPTSLTHDTHLSYPQLIEHEGDIYCLPESCARHRVQLFRALEFPGRWAPDTVLLEGFAGADATVIRYRERWWMFAGDHADQDEAKLYVFHASDLHGPWMPHALNPVKCDLRSSRPAGTPFIAEDGALYRPAQDCSRVYGGAVAVNRVSRLTPDEFEEEIAAHLRPDLDGPCPDGMHTLSAAGDRTLIDGKRHEPLTARMAAALNGRRTDPARAAPRHGQNRLR